MRLVDSGIDRSKALDESNETLDEMKRADDSEGNSELVAERRSGLFGRFVGELV